MDMEQPNPKAQHSQIDFQNSRDNTDDSIYIFKILKIYFLDNILLYFLDHSVKICPSIEDLAGTKSISACTICGKSFKRPGYLQHHTSVLISKCLYILYSVTQKHIHHRMYSRE